MHNKYRGEVSARLDGRSYRLRLTLGALAELETALGADDMIALAARFESGRLSATDAIHIIGAGLRGAGHDISDEAVAAMACDDGASGYMGVVVALLAATFGGDAEAAPEMRDGGAPGEAGGAVPFPGKT